MWILPVMASAVKNVHFSLVGKKKMLDGRHRHYVGYWKS
jgi:hypothetical protein